MIAILLIALLIIVAIISLVSLADNAVRARGNWALIRREKAIQAGFIAAGPMPMLCVSVRL